METSVFGLEILLIVAGILFAIALIYTIVRVIANGKRGLKTVKETMIEKTETNPANFCSDYKIINTGTDPAYMNVPGNALYNTHNNK